MTRRILQFAVVMMLALVLAGCERTKIGDITTDPGRFMDKEVNIAGQVTQSIGAFGKGIYQVDDGTGRLWVLSGSRGVPSKGARVGVKGRIEQAITFLGTNYATVLQETGRRSAAD